MIKKAYPPGAHGKRRRRGLSEFGAQLAEKQKLRLIYNVRERQLKKYFLDSLKTKGVTTEFFLNRLETRLDNVIFRLGLAESRAKARQIVSHGHILLNGKRVDIPSINVKKGDVIEIRKASLNKTLFKDLETKLKKFKPPSWLSLDKKEWKATILGLPSKEDVMLPVDLQKIVEFYSK